MHISARYSTYGNKPAILEVSKPVGGENPDPPTMILKQRLRSIIRQSGCRMEDCSLSVPPPGQPILSANPNAPIGRCEHGVTGVARETLFHGKSGDGEFSKPVESPSGGHPDIAFTIFEKAEDDVT